MKKKIVALILFTTLLLTACINNNKGGPDDMGGPGPQGGGAPGPQTPGADIGSDDSSYGDSLSDLGAYDGLFEGGTSNLVIKCVSGTQGCYKVEGSTIIFTPVSAESVYSISGNFAGNIVINTGDSYKFELELSGFSLICDSTNPITVFSGDEVSIQAKKNTNNYIYDRRAAIPDIDTDSISGAIYSEVDLEISGKGSLFVVSEGNNGIHSKKDLQVKNLDLTVSCKDNALKGNDSVELEAATCTLIASLGDCIKTSNSDISSKGNQRGTVSVTGGSYDLYAACDGIDAAYDVVMGGSDTSINIYTDRYSNYSEEVVSVADDLYYIRFNQSGYTYSVKYYNSEDDYTWVNAEYHSTVSGGMSQYHYYSFPKSSDYSKLQFYVYSSDMEQGQDAEYLVASDLITPSEAYDTIYLTSRGGYIYYDWTNYSTTVSGSRPGGPGGPGGGMNDGNAEKSDHSAKGIKAANSITLNDGALNIKSYDDAIHAKNDSALENGKTALGSVTVNGGSLTLYSNDDGIHADGELKINNGSVSVINAYEGIEGSTVAILGGSVRVIARDDGINATSTSGTTITVGGGDLYIYCGGDGIDSNSRTSYSGIAFTGGRSVIISTSGGNSAIDSEAGYKYTGGSVVAIMPRGAMTGEATKCQSFSSIGVSTSISVTKGEYLVCTVGSDRLTLNMPATISGTAIMLGSSGASATVKDSDSHGLSEGQLVWE